MKNPTIYACSNLDGRREEKMVAMCMDVMRKHTSRPNVQQGALSDTQGDGMLQLGFLAFTSSWICIHEENILLFFKA